MSEVPANFMFSRAKCDNFCQDLGKVEIGNVLMNTANLIWFICCLMVFEIDFAYAAGVC